MTAVGPREWTVVIAQTSLLIFLYIFLYFPIFFIIYVSFVDNTVWPFPPEFTLEWYERLWMMSDFHLGLFNSVLIGAGTGALACIFAASAAIGLLKYQSRWRGLFAVLYLSPLFVAGILIGISSLMFHRNILGLPGHLSTAVLLTPPKHCRLRFWLFWHNSPGMIGVWMKPPWCSVPVRRDVFGKSHCRLYGLRFWEHFW